MKNGTKIKAVLKRRLQKQRLQLAIVALGLRLGKGGFCSLEIKRNRRMVQRTELFVPVWRLQEVKSQTALGLSLGEALGFRENFSCGIKKYVLNDQACGKLLSDKE